MNDPIDVAIERQLRRAWRLENGLQHIRGAARLVVCLAALLAADFLLDWGLLARAEFRFGPLLLVANLAVLSWVMWSGWLRDLAPYDPLRLALAVERRHPELSSLLVSCVQLRHPERIAPNVSLELLAAMRAQALEVSRAIEFRDLAARRNLRKPLGLAAAALLLGAVFAIGWTGHGDTLLQRIAGADASYPDHTSP